MSKPRCNKCGDDGDVSGIRKYTGANSSISMGVCKKCKSVCCKSAPEVYLPRHPEPPGPPINTIDGIHVPPHLQPQVIINGRLDKKKLSRLILAEHGLY